MQSQNEYTTDLEATDAETAEAPEWEGEVGERLRRELCPSGGGACPALRADVLKVPHPGSEKLDGDFLKAVKPDWAVLSAGFQNKKHHLPRVAVNELRELGAAIFSTSADGFEDVVLTISGRGGMSWEAPSNPFHAWRPLGGSGREDVEFSQGRPES